MVLANFITEATNAGDLFALMIDDLTNVHTKRRPKDQETSTARNMATVLLKRFQGIPAIPSQASMNAKGVSSDLLIEYFKSNLSTLASTYASVMPPWIRLSFYDPEMGRKRVDIHDYQAQNDIRKLRKMKDCRLVDELELPLKSPGNFLEAATHAVNLGLGNYLANFICPQPGDWPAQFYMRQIQYNIPEEAPNCLQNIVPFIGPLHVQLNARENLCLQNINLFKKAYGFIFGERKVLANKPKPWRISLLEELIYGGWLLIREQVVIAFSKCKDLEYLTLLNILDNYLPLVLSIYSAVFKTGKTDLYVSSMFRCWMMFFCFKHHHYDKAPLVWLSDFLYWKSQDHPL